MNNKFPDIKYLFEPKSVAVIGASHKPEKIGYQVLNNIIKGGYKGEVYPVNPNKGKVLGLDVLASVTDVRGEVDIAVMAIPEKLVLKEVKRCAEKKVKHLVIITSGFSEIGNVFGEKKVVSLAEENGMRVLGPNIFGIYSSSVSLNATFGPGDIKKGSVAIVTQSGAIGIAMIGKTTAENIGLSAIISVGNKADIDESDLLEYLKDHDKTKVILVYIEGVKGGERLVRFLKEATQKKPVVVIKSGRSKRGAMAAASHTGSLAGADEVFDDIIRQCGVIRAENIQEALDWCKFFTSTPLPKGGNSVIITNGGGMGVLAADACEKYNVALFDNSKSLKESFSEVLPTFGSSKNPIDLTGQATKKEYKQSLDIALKHPDIHSVICLGCETASFGAESFAKITQDGYKNYKLSKPVLFSIFGGVKAERCVFDLRKKGVPVFPDVYEAVSSLGALYAQYQNVTKGNFEKPFSVQIKAEVVLDIIKKVRADGRTSLLFSEADEVMRAAGIAMPKSGIAKSIVSAINFFKKIGSSVAMKIVSKDIIHKSDAGGVILDLENENEIMDAYESIMYNCRSYNPDAVIEGIQVVEMVKPGIETIVGARRDPSFGSVVMFGLGGIYVEVMKDVSFRSYPLGKREVQSMISQIRSYPLLLGVRGEKKKDIDSIVNTIFRVGEILKACPDISDIEINPLMVYEHGEGVKAVDARILLVK